MAPIFRSREIRWLEAEVGAWVAVGEFDPPRRVERGLAATGYEELCACCTSAAVGVGIVPEEATVKFVYRPSA